MTHPTVIDVGFSINVGSYVVMTRVPLDYTLGAPLD